MKAATSINNLRKNLAATKTNKNTKSRIFRTHKPEELGLEEWQRLLRQQEFLLENLGAHKILFNVQSNVQIIEIKEVKKRMNTPTDIQIIKQNGHPAFVVIPDGEYIKAFPNEPWVTKQNLIPHEVVGLTIKKGFTLARAWREYLGLTQKDIADKMGITQAALSRMESGEKKLRKATLEKLAKALGIKVEQVRV